MDNKRITVLLIEDNPGDARLINEFLAGTEKNQFDLNESDQLSTGLKYLSRGGIDIVLLDLGLPDSQGLDTLRKVTDSFPELPIVVFTGLVDEELGVKAVQEGAQDYLVKGQVDSNLLVRSIRYAIERQNLISQIKTLSGMLPICSSCKKIRDDEGYWNVLERYIMDHSEAEFTHGICPDCMLELYPKTYKAKFIDHLKEDK